MRVSGLLPYICLSLCIGLLFGTFQGAAAVPKQRKGDPPRIYARNLFAYRHLQLFNPDYVKWVEDNLLPIDYVRKSGAMRLKWDAFTNIDLQASPHVVMVTQTTVSRLAALRDTMREWNGPVTVAVYIEYKVGTVPAASCESKVVQYMKETAEGLWPRSDAAPPISVSFLYAAYDIPNAACQVKLSHPSTDIPPQTRRDGDGVATLHGSKPEKPEQTAEHTHGFGYSPHSLPQRLENSTFQQRTLKLTGRVPGSIQAGQHPTAVKPVWHFRETGNTKLQVSARPWKEVYDGFYPVNALRNLAWEQVPSGVFAFLIDVDFVPTPMLHSELTVGKWKAELQSMRSAYFESQSRETLVLPAFERTWALWPDACYARYGCAHIHGLAMPRTFEMLRTMLRREKYVDIFNRRSFQMGHGCYSWMTWLQEEQPQEMVPMEYAHPCEPYVIALSDAMPRYDERFRGRGQNKIEQLTHMAMWGFKWRLLPGHFVLHVPHPSTAKAGEAWDIHSTPLALIKAKIKEVEKEPQFRRHVVQNVPVSVAQA